MSSAQPLTNRFYLQSPVIARDEARCRQMHVTSNIRRRKDFDGIMRRQIPVHLSVAKSPVLAGISATGASCSRAVNVPILIYFSSSRAARRFSNSRNTANVSPALSKA